MSQRLRSWRRCPAVHVPVPAPVHPTLWCPTMYTLRSQVPARLLPHLLRPCHRYIEYEGKLEELRSSRRKSRGISGKKALAEFCIIRRIHFIYERATRKFRWGQEPGVGMGWRKRGSRGSLSAGEGWPNS